MDEKRTGLIYKYTNKINGKIYIGQTRQSLQERDKRHINAKDNTYFHRALQNYGRDNFTLEVVEDDIPLDQLDEKERYYINFYESFHTTGKGYNLTEGGQGEHWTTGRQILNISQVKEIRNLILNTDKTFTDIGKKYNISSYAIGDINKGATFYDKTLKYPLRPFTPSKKSELNKEKVATIIDMLYNTEMSQKEIALATDTLEYTVGEINRGHNSWCPKNLDYPIKKAIQPNTYQNILTKEQVIQICHDICFCDDMSLQEIGVKYGVAKNTIGDISRGISWKEITHQFVCPLRKNKEQNQSIYKAIYGIV